MNKSSVPCERRPIGVCASTKGCRGQVRFSRVKESEMGNRQQKQAKTKGLAWYQ